MGLLTAGPPAPPETHLRALAAALHVRGRTAIVIEGRGGWQLRAGNVLHSALSVTVRCRVADGGVWFYMWEWGEPIAPVDQLDAVAVRVARLVRGADE